jgi:competence protein ComFC
VHLPLSYRLYRSLWTCLDWLYPPTCGGCGTQGLRWCAACQAAVEPLAPPLCQHCGQPLTSPGLCRECRESPPAFKVARSWAAFDGPVRSALHRLKYRRDLGLGEVLALPLVGLAARQSWAIDMLLPVPLGVARFAQRGYNQSALLARPLALAMRVSLTDRPGCAGRGDPLAGRPDRPSSAGKM